MEGQRGPARQTENEEAEGAESWQMDETVKEHHR